MGGTDRSMNVGAVMYWNQIIRVIPSTNHALTLRGRPKIEIE